VGIALID
jgi:hypothetical protein